jgi:2-oxoglutarate dehydrogenase E2 component (dihydrolipoamide succinyltransferase)
LTAEEKVDPAKVAGTGKGGRLTKGDVINHLRSRAGGSESEESKTDDQEKPRGRKEREPDESSVEEEPGGRFTRRKMSPLRRKIAAQLVMSQQSTATLTTFNECDMSEVMALRKKAQEKFQADHGVKLGFMSFFIKATVEGLKAVPSINSRIEGDDLILNHYYDIGVAVGTERGLVVPVVHEADKKSFADLERDIADFATRARQGKIKIEDLQGGIFTISNGGVYGSLMGTPILNPPQSGILGMHAIKERVVAVNGQPVVRPMMYLALSYDHRAVDGKEAVTFLVKVKEAIENPTSLLLEM